MNSDTSYSYYLYLLQLYQYLTLQFQNNENYLQEYEIILKMQNYKMEL